MGEVGIGVGMWDRGIVNRSMATLGVGAWVMCAPVQAVVIFSEDFEAPTVSGTVSTTPTGWTSTRTDKTGLSDSAKTGKTNSQYAHVDDYPNNTLFDGALTTTSSILSDTLLVHYRYRLSCDVSANSTANDVAIDLIAGSTVIASVTNGIAVANDLSGTTLVLDFMPYPGHANLGETLSIRLRMVAGSWNQPCYFDNLWLDATDSATDVTAPTPDALTWVQEPTTAGGTSVVMTVTTASDTNWVEYMFTNTVNGNSSGWIDVTTWSDTGLSDGVSYNYQVAARDTSANSNETAYSTVGTTTASQYMVFYDSFEYPVVSGETIKTQPSGWTDVSTAGDRLGLGFLNGSTYSNMEGDQAAWLNVYNTTPIMETTIAILDVDLVADVRYSLNFLAAQSGGSYVLYADLLAGTNLVMTASVAPSSKVFSANIASNACLPVATDPGIGQALKIRLRVTGGSWNQQSYIDNLKLIGVPSSLDTDPPTPDPLTWVQTPTPAEGTGAVMTISVASDPHWVDYFFTNTANGNTSGWINVTTWRDTGLADGVSYSYKVKARDRSENYNETAWSTVESVTADRDILFYDSFELPVVSGETTKTLPDAWADVSTAGDRLGLGYLNGSSYSNFEGDQAAWFNVYNTTPIMETTTTNLDATFEPGYEYTISYNAGDWNSYTMHADLMAGTAVVTTATLTTPANRDFSGNVISHSYYIEIEELHLFEALKLRLRVTNGSWDQQSYFDNLLLSSVRSNAVWNVAGTNLAATSADTVGAVSSTNTTVFVTAYWGETDPGATAAGWDYTNHMGSFAAVDFLYVTNVIAAGLTPNTQYYYMFRATNNLDWEVWDDASKSFYTVTTPSVDNASGATPETTTSATIRGELTAGQSALAWFCWGDEDAGTVSTSTWDNVVFMGNAVESVAFSTVVSGLATNTTYWYRCYVMNAAGDAWSQIVDTFNGVPIGVNGALGISYYPITDDTDSDFSSSKVYTHLVDFGTDSPRALINGVQFQAGGTTFGTIAGTSATVGSGSTTIGSAHGGNASADPYLNGASFCDMEDLMEDMTYNDATGLITLTGLTSGQRYRFRLYNRPWGASAGSDRDQDIGFDTDGVGSDISTAEDTGEFAADDATQPDPSFGTFSQVYALTYDYYLSVGVTQLKVYVNRKSGDSGTYHMYGLSNEEVSESIIDNLPPTNVTYNTADFRAALETGTTNYTIHVYWGLADGGNTPGSWTYTDTVGVWSNVASTNITYVEAGGISESTTNWYTFRAVNDTTDTWATPSWQVNTPDAGRAYGSIFNFR